ncbi:MAG TPA: hypothetical protein VKQ71_08495, partial [Acidimicrobiales bacterium]|nr:hypothetical protein [Acidimicrobiales bacterium]
MSTSWFDVDKAGLARLVDRRGKATAILELVSNAWDQDVRRVCVNLRTLSKERALLLVNDDDPKGFSRLADAFTLFAPSEKVGEATKRGRFNMGEKLLLSLCESAIVHTTTGRITFDAEGRHEEPEFRRSSGSEVTARLRMSKAEVAEALALLGRLIAPAGIETLVNGNPLPARVPAAVLRANLSSEIADASGTLRRTRRMTDVELHDAPEAGGGWVYELGIP